MEKIKNIGNVKAFKLFLNALEDCTTKDTYIDDNIALLQAGRIKFQFLEYLSANSGMSCRELENLLHYAYRSLVDGAMASSSTVTPTPVLRTKKARM